MRPLIRLLNLTFFIEQALSLAWCFGVEDEGVQKLIKGCLQLRKLDLTGVKASVIDLMW